MIMNMTKQGFGRRRLLPPFGYCHAVLLEKLSETTKMLFVMRITASEIRTAHVLITNRACYRYTDVLKGIILKQDVLGTTNSLLSFDTTRTS
jgi:hypothetical protein